MAGVAAISEFEDLLQCMICFEPYRNPKMLKCCHTFCQECLQGYYRTYQQQRRAVPGKLPCPTCREFTSLPSNGVPGLRNDFKVAKIEEMFKTMNVRKEKAKSMSCDSCHAQKKSSTAKVFCATCSMNFCDSCLKKHSKNPLFKSHNVSTKGRENKTSDLSCKVHKKEQGRYFCRTCEAIICTLCIMSEHEGHNVEEVNEMFRQYREEVKNLQNIVNDKMATLKQKARDMETLRSLNLKSCQQSELAIKEKTEEMISQLRKQERELLTKLRHSRDEKLKKISEEHETANYLIAKGYSMQEFATMTVQQNSLRLMALHEDLVQRMRTVSELDVIYADPDTENVITFLPGHQDVTIGRIQAVEGRIADLVKHMEPKLSASSASVRIPNERRESQRGHPPMRRTQSESFGNIDRNGPVPVFPNAPSSYPGPRQNLLHAKPKLLFNINKLGNNKGEIRDPLSVACLLNGDIVITEWGNKRIQIFDSVGKHVMLLGNGNVGPQGVSVTLRGNILITDANQKRLQVFTPSGHTIAKWGLGKFFSPCGVAVSPNGNIIITDIAEHKVSIYRGEQRCLNRFGQQGKGDNEFNNPLYVTTGPHNEIIISDSDNHCVKVFDSSGRFILKFGSEGSGDGQLKFPRGVVVDHDGNILVADRNNDRICQFSPRGNFLRHLLTKKDGIRDPYGLAVSYTRNLLVTESVADRAALKMFQID